MTEEKKAMPNLKRSKIGVVTSGSLVEGLAARLEEHASVEDMRVGKFVVVQGKQYAFFSMITDVVLEATTQKVLTDPPNGDPFIHDVLAGTSTYGTVTLSPRLMLPANLEEGTQPLPVKTIPGHFAAVYEANEDDFSHVFGQEDNRHFEIGQPLDMDVPVCINLERFVERSNGVFGKSGTGKSFLTRLLLCGTMHAGTASNLIFDMHSEYGWETRSEDNSFVKGLRQLFGSQVLVYTLDPDFSRDRKVDGQVVIGLNQIDVEDVITLQDELNLSSTAAESSYMLADHYKEQWLSALLEMDSEAIQEFAERSGAHAGAISALKRKLSQVKRMGFVRDQADFSVVNSMIDALENGRHVILEFGRHSHPREYMLVANIITRRIHRRWIEQTEHYMRTKNKADRPRQLVITIEEAHKFLTPSIAKQTVFGTIAREMRKYSVTLLVVDQRPSSIDAEVMSQLGTRITALLNDDKDIDAVFSGVSGSSGLKAVLASLDSRQQALVLGHAVPMPVVIRTRPYDEDLYRAVGRDSTPTIETRRKALAEIDELFPD
jgi:hypothetical protein